VAFSRGVRLEYLGERGLTIRSLAFRRAGARLRACAWRPLLGELWLFMPVFYGQFLDGPEIECKNQTIDITDVTHYYGELLAIYRIICTSN